jgi:pimeloyl-ACP methyl ester carboxylesterase
MKDPLVLLPGMMCDARLFGPQVAALSADRVIISAPITQADRVEAIAAQLLVQLPPRFALAGLSMGGIVAMELMRQASERIIGVALMDTNPLAEKPEIAARRAPQVAAVGQGRLTEVMRDEMKPNYLAPGAQRQDVLSLVLEMAQSVGPDVFVRQSHALMHRPDQTETLRRFAGPALVLCGRYDALCPVSRHEMMADLLPDARLEILEGSGHLPCLEEPKATSAALSDWLDRCDS